jgi:hypothetical protein
VDDRLVADAEAVPDVVTGAIGPLISKSSTSTSRYSGAPRFADAGAVDVVDATGLDRFDDDAAGVAAGTVAAAGVADTRAALADCGVVAVGIGADFLDGVGRTFVC